MLDASGRGGMRGGRGPRRALEWFDIDLNSTVPATAQLGIRADGAMVSDEKKGATITRIIMDFIITPVTAGLDVGARLAMGLYMQIEDGFAAGAFADPQTANDQPGWLWRTLRRYDIGSLTNQIRTSSHVHIDLHSQRKYRGEDDVLVLIFNNESTNSVDIDGWMRTLVKKP